MNARKFLLFTLTLLAGTTFAQSTSNRLPQDRLTEDLLWKLKRIGEIAVSPDYSTVAFTLREYNVAENSSESNIYLVPVAGGIISQLTTTKGTEYNITWAKDGKSIFYIAKAEQGMNIFQLVQMAR